MISPIIQIPLETLLYKSKYTLSSLFCLYILIKKSARVEWNICTLTLDSEVMAINRMYNTYRGVTTGEWFERINLSILGESSFYAFLWLIYVMRKRRWRVHLRKRFSLLHDASYICGIRATHAAFALRSCLMDSFEHQGIFVIVNFYLVCGKSIFMEDLLKLVYWPRVMLSHYCLFINDIQAKKNYSLAFLSTYLHFEKI